MTVYEEVELSGMPVKPPPPPPQPFIVEGTYELRFDLKIDLAALIRRYPKEYAEVDLVAGGWDFWQRPIIFLEECLREETAGTSFVGSEIVETWVEDEFNERERWSEKKFEELCSVCPEARVDP